MHLHQVKYEFLPIQSSMSVTNNFNSADLLKRHVAFAVFETNYKLLLMKAEEGTPFELLPGKLVTVFVMIPIHHFE